MPRKKVQVQSGGTSWVLIGNNGATYASVAALNAAGDTPFPFNSDPGLRSDGAGLSSQSPSITMKTQKSDGTDGTTFYYAVIETAADLVVPAFGFPVDGSNQGFTIDATEIYGLWLQPGASGDTITLYYFAP